jgi:hypothetical protein
MDAAAVTTLVGSVDFATIITGIATIAGALMIPKVAVKGARMILGMVK